MTYSVWGSADGCEFLVLDGEMTPEQRGHAPGLSLVKVITADSWDDAMRQYHEWQGWEPYKPFDGDE